MAFVKYTASLSNLSEPKVVVRLVDPTDNSVIDERVMDYTAPTLNINSIYVGLEAGKVYEIRHYESPDGSVLTTLPLNLKVEAVATLYNYGSLLFVCGRGLPDDPAPGDNQVLSTKLKDKEFIVFRDSVFQNAIPGDPFLKMTILDTPTQGGFKIADINDQFAYGQELLVLIQQPSQVIYMSGGGSQITGTHLFDTNNTITVDHIGKMILLETTAAPIDIALDASIPLYTMIFFINVGTNDANFFAQFLQAGSLVSTVNIPVGASGYIVKDNLSYYIHVN